MQANIYNLLNELDGMFNYFEYRQVYEYSFND